jgi:hypothetical protein
MDAPRPLKTAHLLRWFVSALAAWFDGLTMSGIRFMPGPSGLGTPTYDVSLCPSTALGVLSLSRDIWVLLSGLGKTGFSVSSLELPFGSL